MLSQDDLVVHNFSSDKLKGKIKRKLNKLCNGWNFLYFHRCYKMSANNAFIQQDMILWYTL